MVAPRSSYPSCRVAHRIFCLPFAVFFGFLAPPAWPATYTVAPGGLDSNPGTAAWPWATIQHAADTLQPGDTVNVLAGNYASQRVNVARSGAAGAPITYQAQGAVVTKGFSVVNIVHSPYQMLPVDHIVIRGFEIAGTDYVRWHGEVSAGVYIKGGWVTVEDNSLHDCSLGGIELSGTPAEPDASHDCVVRNNRLYRNEMVGIDIHGQNHLIEGNEVWATVQCHPTLTAVEDVAADNPSHLPCPNYPGVGGLDADGMRFFGSGHIIRANSIHDIHYGPPGLDPAAGDYNDDPHIDCFQTWTDDSYNEAAVNILFERNWCDNCQGQSPNETGQGFMIEQGSGSAPPAGLTFRNNVIRAYRGMNILDAQGLVIVNNTFVMDLHLPTAYYPGGIGLSNAPNAVIRNNLLYDMNYHSISLKDATSQTAQTGKNLEYRSDGLPLVTNDSYYGPARRAADYWGVNPDLVDPYALPRGNYRPAAGSQAIDRGENLGPLVPDDYDGLSRPQGAGFDVGAYEYSPLPPSSPKNLRRR